MRIVGHRRIPVVTSEKRASEAARCREPQNKKGKSCTLRLHAKGMTYKTINSDQLSET